VLGVVSVVLLLVATAFFVAAEFALVAVDRTRMEQSAARGGRRSRLVLGVIRRLSFHLSGAQLGVTLCSLVLGVLAEPVLARLFHHPVAALIGERGARGTSVVVALVLSTVASMVLGELVPKNIVLARPERAAQNLSGPLRLFSLAMTPIIRVSNGAANWVVRRFGVEPREELASARSVEELELLIRLSGEQGAIDREAVQLVTRSIRFGDKTAADALVPRVEVRALEVGTSVPALIAASIETGHSRFPVQRGDLDDLVGIVHVKDVYRVPADRRDSATIDELVTAAHVVPETRPLDDLLLDLRARRLHLAVVVDEHGGTAGIVTLEDLLEEIVGEITDEYDPMPASVTVPGPGESVVVSAALHPDELFDAVGLRIPDGPYETLAGFVLQRLGHIPSPGERVGLDGWALEVTAVERHRVVSVRVTPPDDTGSAGDGDQADP
jgi:CBS domain containing-hemolysin-like protein